MPRQSILTSVQEYLNTSFEDGDREYVDGRIVERNLGEKDHSRPQGALIAFFWNQRQRLATFAFPEQRIQLKPTRFRVPDVCVYIGQEPDEQVFTSPPFLVVEILSKDDRASDINEKINDYLSFGVPFVWILDPRTRRGYIYTSERMQEAKDGVMRTWDPDIELALSEIF